MMSWLNKSEVIFYMCFTAQLNYDSCMLQVSVAGLSGLTWTSYQHKQIIYLWQFVIKN